MAQLLEGGTLPTGPIIIESGKGAVSIDGDIVRLRTLNLPVLFTVGTAAGNVGAVSALGGSVAVYRTGTTYTTATSTTPSVAHSGFFESGAGESLVVTTGKGTVEVTITGAANDAPQNFTLDLGNVNFPFLLEPIAAAGNVTLNPLGSSVVFAHVA